METAFVQHVGKHTRLSSELLRAVRFVGWTMLVARFSLRTCHGSAGTLATLAIVVAIYVATSLEGAAASFDCLLLMCCAALLACAVHCHQKCEGVGVNHQSALRH
jgi:hypothetical protein